MANQSYVLKVQIDGTGALSALDKIEDKAEAVGNSIKSKVGGEGKKTGGAFAGLADQAGQLDDLFGKVGGSAGGVADAFKVLRTALIGSGIGAIVVLVGELINNFDVLLGLIDGVSSAQEELAASSQAVATAEQNKLAAISEQENILKLQGKSEKEILQLKIAQAEQAIAATQASIEQNRVILKSQVDAAKRNREILTGILQFLTAPLRLLLLQIDTIGKALGQNFGLVEGLDKQLDNVAGLLFDPEQVQAEGEAAIAEQEKVLMGLKNQQAGFQLQVQAINKNAADKAIAEQQRIADEEAKILEERRKKTAEFQAIALQGTLDTATKQAELVKATNAGQLKAVQDRIKMEMQFEEAKYQQNLKLASDVTSAAIALNEAFAGQSEKQAERSFKIGKALAIAQAVQNTFAGANAVLKDPTYVGPARFIAVASAIGLGLANVVKIARTKFQPGGGADTGGSSSPTPSIGGSFGGGGGAPAFNAIDPAFLQNKPPQATQAYVLAGAVTSSVEAREKIDNLARL